MDRIGKITLEIGRGVFCKNLPREAKDKIFQDLRFDNPIYKNAEKHGGYVGVDVMRYLYFFEVSADKKTTWVPRGYVWYLKKWLHENNYKTKIIDKTLLLPKMDLEFHGELRHYQTLAVNDMVTRYPCGVLEAATGSGKTICALGIIARRNQPTLIIVHSKELLYQWQEAIKTFLHYDCGLIGAGKCDIKDISVGIINTVKNRLGLLTKRFGMIVLDECHRSPSASFSETLQEFPARHYLGLSATTFRNDGLGNAIFAHIGHKLHTVDKEMLHNTGAVLKPKIIRVETDFKVGKCFADEANMAYSSIIKKLCEDAVRNNLIATKIKHDLKQFKQNIIVVSDRVAHCKRIAEILRSKNIKNHVLSGSTGKKDRMNIVSDVKSGKCKVLIASISLISEGFDSPNLSALFLTTPVAFSGRVLQVAGRILRPDKNDKSKVPRIFDFRDVNVNVLRNSGFRRDRIYSKQWPNL
ncbi:MAG: DEAD/DEAH box helicase [Candidatus Tenebribacter davisii]|nr:DEAD/DEAH box helicase [Candidatus Tenebribacter davisii]